MINHCVLSAPRSGSNLLCALLNIHPDCVNRGEIFGKLRSLFIEDMLKFIEDTTSNEVPEYLVEKLLNDLWFFDYSKYTSIGFKSIRYHDILTNGQIISFLKKNNVKIIYLKRKNKLKQVISWMKAGGPKESGFDDKDSSFFDIWMLSGLGNPWTDKNNKLSPKKIDVDKVLHQLDVFDKEEMFFDEVLGNSNLVLEVYYEDLVKDLSVDFSNDNNKELQKCYDFLDLDYQHLINNKDIKVNNFLSKMDFMARPQHINEGNIPNHKSYNNYFDRIEELENSKTFIMTKSRKWPLRECIKNYDELVKALEGTKYKIYTESKNTLNIFLIGFMGVGKTTVGKSLAKKLNYTFYDTDDNEHWKKFGYPNGTIGIFWDDRKKFHDIQTDVLKDIISNGDKNSVISTGGSIVLREENIDLMKSNGIVIFLNANAKIINERINNTDDSKKSHIKGSSLESTESFMKDRGPKYKFADLEIDTSDKSIEEVCHNIKLYLHLLNNNIDVEVLKKNDVFLVGGSVLRLFMDLPLDTDLDFYVETEENYKNVSKYFDDNFDFQYEPTNKFRSYKCNFNEVQLMNGLQSIDEFIGNSDFRITKGYFSFRNKKFVFHEKFFDDIKNKKLVYDTDNSPGPLSTMRRTNKFKKLGFEIDIKSFRKLSKDIDSTEGEIDLDLLSGTFKKKSWLRNEDVYPIVPNIDVFVNWLMDIKDHPNLEKFNAYLWGGFISRPHETKDIDVLITKRNGQHATLKELELLMVDMFNSAYDNHKFFLDTHYMRIPQWIGDYPRNKEFLKSVERKQLFITITKYEDKDMECKYRRYGLLNCAYTGSFTLRGVEPSSLIHRWVDLNGNYARMVDLRKIIKYYENNNKRNIEDFLNKFQEYSGY